MTDFLKYSNYKLITYIINDDKSFEKLDSYKNIILVKDFIISLNVFCEVFVDENKLDEEQVLNFKKLLTYIGRNSDKYNDLINKMFVSLNKTDFKNKSKYYVENYICRFYGHDRYKMLLKPSSFPEFVKKIKHSASKDYLFLTMLTEFSDEEFNKALDSIILDEYFLLSANQIIAEVPIILRNRTFIERFKRIAQINLVYINKITDKRVRQIVYRESKYYAKYLKEE